MAGKSPRLGPKKYRDNGDRCFAIAVTCTTTLAGEDHGFEVDCKLLRRSETTVCTNFTFAESPRSMVPTRKPPPGPMDHELAVIAVTLLTIQREARGPLASPHCCTVFGEAAGGKGASMELRSYPNALARGSQEARVKLSSPRSVAIGGFCRRRLTPPALRGWACNDLPCIARTRSEVPSSLSHHDRSVLQHAQASCHVLLPIHV